LTGRGCIEREALREQAMRRPLNSEATPLPDSTEDAPRNMPDLWRAALIDPGPEAHKYRRGSALVWSGPPLATGASRLAAIVVTLAGDAAALAVQAAHVTAIMLKPAKGAADLARLVAETRANALVLGPAMGIGAPTRHIIAAALAAGVSCVLDADALTSFAGDAAALADLIARATAPVVLTPHEGEFTRLMGDEHQFSAAESRFSRARDAARMLGAAVVLKGSKTVIAAADGRAAVNDNAPPWLATAGSGDVLAGVIGGLLAQGMPGFEAACAGVWLHGLAGAIAGRGMIADDLAVAVSPAVRSLWESLAGR
jgi:ADP-dependent NAD(P)H-hydrate dehydratase / NAD(P)H-hydrate epimerase